VENERPFEGRFCFQEAVCERNCFLFLMRSGKRKKSVKKGFFAEFFVDKPN